MQLEKLVASPYVKVSWRENCHDECQSHCPWSCLVWAWPGGQGNHSKPVTLVNPDVISCLSSHFNDC